MTLQQMQDGLRKGIDTIQMIRGSYTQFRLPIADRKLIRISDYLERQMAEIECLQWIEFESDEPRVTNGEMYGVDAATAKGLDPNGEAK